MRDFSKHSEIKIGLKTIKHVMFKMVELIEKSSGTEMEKAGVGAVMYELSGLSPFLVFYVVTCWSGKRKVVEIFLKILPNLLEAQEEKDGEGSCWQLHELCFHPWKCRGD